MIEATVIANNDRVIDLAKAAGVTKADGVPPAVMIEAAAHAMLELPGDVTPGQVAFMRGWLALQQRRKERV